MSKRVEAKLHKEIQALKAELEKAREINGHVRENGEVASRRASTAEVRRDEALTAERRARADVNRLKKMLFDSECEVARLRGKLERIDETERAASRPQVKTTQEIISRDLPGARDRDRFADGGFINGRARDEDHWTSL